MKKYTVVLVSEIEGSLLNDPWRRELYGLTEEEIRIVEEATDA